jgi:hypothetical protein
MIVRPSSAESDVQEKPVIKAAIRTGRRSLFECMIEILEFEIKKLVLSN